eukprot:PhF_6_TR28680/c0_g1_i1/m.42150
MMMHKTLFNVLIAITIIVSSFSSSLVMAIAPFQNTTVRSDGTIDVILDVPPRYMWGWYDDTLANTRGYCGETSFQSHGIYYGNWISSELMRQKGDNYELLIGTTDVKTAINASFTYDVFDNSGSSGTQINRVKPWIANHIEAGHIIVGGWMEFKLNGQSDYDHIMPVVGYRKDSAGNAVGLYYNDLWLANQSRYFNFSVDVKNRTQCNTSVTQTQPVPYCIPANVSLYMIALTGIVDPLNETIRMQLIVPSNKEPDWGFEDKLNQKPILFNVSAKFTNLTIGAKYGVLRFNSFSSLPKSQFYQSQNFTNKTEFIATSVNMTINNFDSFMTNTEVYYRTVVLQNAWNTPTMTYFQDGLGYSGIRRNFSQIQDTS